MTFTSVMSKTITSTKTTTARGDLRRGTHTYAHSHTHTPAGLTNTTHTLSDAENSTILCISMKDGSNHRGLRCHKLRRSRTLFFFWQHVKLTAHHWQYRTANKCVSQVSTTSMRCSLQFHLHVYTGFPLATQKRTLSVVYIVCVPLLHEMGRSLTWVTVCNFFFF